MKNPVALDLESLTGFSITLILTGPKLTAGQRLLETTFEFFFSIQTKTPDKYHFKYIKYARCHIQKNNSALHFLPD